MNMKKVFLLLFAGIALVYGTTLYKKSKGNKDPIATDDPIYLEDETVAEAAKVERVDKIHQLFSTGKDKLPFVETVTYSPRVPWLEGRAAWIADYASFYGTSRHFIARSLNQKADYISQKVAIGDRFNVFSKDKKIEFHLLLDLSRKEIDFSYIDMESGEKELLKTYPVAVGMENSQMPSGCLTPLGTYHLGKKIAIYKPGIMGRFHDEETEMIQVFGTRWIPILEDDEDELRVNMTRFGLHGAPHLPEAETGEYVEYRECVGTNVSEGCIRLLQEDMEELFSIVITKPTTIEIVNPK